MPGLFSSESLERVRAANDIVDVVGSVIPLKRAGASFVALCPFHKEKTPSFHVNPQRQIFHCFGCGKGGDVFGFIKEYENVDFPEAVRRLADRARIPLDYQGGAPGDGQARHIKEVLLRIHEQIAQRWQSALATEAGGQIARDYLAKRGVPTEAISLFRLGYAPDSWEDTINWSKSKGFDLADIERAGLILKRQEGPGYYDRFRGRLMFPICDEQGRVVAFSGRVLAGDEKTAKYVNSPETPIFTKGKVFYGLDKSKRLLLEAGFAVICEGQLDLIACFTAGVQNVVAPQGTAFTADHARVLRRYVDEVVLCFDADEAGQNAALRSLDHLLAAGMAVRVASVPSPHDPDSFIKQSGPEAFKKLIQQADGFFDWHLKRLCETNDLKTDKGRLAVLRSMSEAVHKTGNEVLVDTYAQKTALRLGVDPGAVRQEFRKGRRSKPVPAETPAPEGTAAPEPVKRPSPVELWLLKLLLGHDDLGACAASRLDVKWIEHPLVADLARRRMEAHKARTWVSLAAFLDECGAPELQNLVTEAVSLERPLPNPQQQLSDLTLKLRNQFLDGQLAAVLHKLNQPETSEDERLRLLREQTELRALKRKPIADPGPSCPQQSPEA